LFQDILSNRTTKLFVTAHSNSKSGQLYVLGNNLQSDISCAGQVNYMVKRACKAPHFTIFLEFLKLEMVTLKI
jgi:hypothetical protein